MDAKTPRKPKPSAPRFHFTPAAVLALGLLSIVLLLVIHAIGERQTTQEFLSEKAITQAELAIANSHLWLEEHLTGDESIDVDGEILEPLDSALGLIQRLLWGGELENGGTLRPLGDPELRRRAETVRDRLTAFRNRSAERSFQGARAGAGTAVDRSYDEVFHALLAETKALRLAIEARWVRGQARSRLFVGGLVGVWAILVVGAALGLWSHEQRRREADRALRQREAELREAQKMEAVGRLAGSLAHDINNYLGAIRGYCEVARLKGEATGPLARRMDDAIETVDNVSALIRQLLAFSRRQPVEPEVVDVNQVVDGLESMMQRLIGEDVELETRLAEELWAVEIDPTQMEQVLVNLLVNARDAMPRGGTVVIETRNVETDAQDLRWHAVEPGRYVLVSVADNGLGIAPAVRDRIFEPFFTTKGGDHSGLGLATVYGIVQQSGGYTVIESKVGEGTAVKALLPAVEGEAAEVVPSTRRRRRPAAIESVPARILLVEDNSAMRASTRDLLETLGHEVVVAADGEEALRLAAGVEVDLVITDVVMPGMSGRDLVERLHAARPGLRCLYISGYTDKVRLEHGLSEDRVDFLPKPFDADSLSRKIGRLLGAA